MLPSSKLGFGKWSSNKMHMKSSFLKYHLTCLMSLSRKANIATWESKYSDTGWSFDTGYIFILQKFNGYNYYTLYMYTENIVDTTVVLTLLT